MPAGNQAERKLAVKLGEAEWWQKPPVATRKLLNAGGVAELHLLEMHDKMDYSKSPVCPARGSYSYATLRESFYSVVSGA